MMITHEAQDCLRKARSLVMRAVAADNEFIKRMSVFSTSMMTEEEFTEKNIERGLELALITGEITTLIDSLTGEH